MRCVVWVCVAALAILDARKEVDDDTLGWWLAERQLPNGGLNGRPEKLEDVRTPQLNPVFRLISLLSVGLLQPLGAFQPVDTEQAALDRRRQTRGIHPISTGTCVCRYTT